VPKHLQQLYQELPPLFYKQKLQLVDCKNTSLIEYSKFYGLVKGDRIQLISGFSAKNVVYSTDYIRFLISLGCIVTNVQLVISFNKTEKFSDFINAQVKARINADLNGDEVGSSLAKYICNSWYVKLNISQYDSFIAQIYFYSFGMSLYSPRDTSKTAYGGRELYESSITQWKYISKSTSLSRIRFRHR
jgi:hypothetical protein